MSAMSGEFPKLVFLGGGQMAEAIIRGVVAAGLTTPDRITASEIVPARRQYLSDKVGIRAEASNLTALEHGEVIILALKPQDMQTVLKEIGGSVREDQLVVSIAAGVPLAKLEPPFEAAVPVIRVMPNTPCLVGQGMAAIARGKHATEAHAEIVLRIFNATGKAISLAEKDLDAVTALSGSGPGYVAVVIEALADAGVRVGLTRDVATTLAIQTVLGTAQMLSETGQHPARLKDIVSSPGGTTIAGIHALERAGIRAAFMDAIVAATDRSRELGS
jgi:pyrroline-5-carboxylate reductase